MLIVVAWWTEVFASRFAAIQIVAVAICPFAKTYSNCVGTAMLSTKSAHTVLSTLILRHITPR